MLVIRICVTLIVIHVGCVQNFFVKKIKISSVQGVESNGRNVEFAQFCDLSPYKAQQIMIHGLFYTNKLQQLIEVFLMALNAIIYGSQKNLVYLYIYGGGEILQILCHCAMTNNTIQLNMVSVLYNTVTANNSY